VFHGVASRSSPNERVKVPQVAAQPQEIRLLCPYPFLIDFGTSAALAEVPKHAMSDGAGTVALVRGRVS
jgi:hypothetical protein